MNHISKYLINSPITVWGFQYGDYMARTYLHRDSAPEKFGILLKRELCKYRDIEKLQAGFDRIIIIDPLHDKVEDNDLAYLLSNNLVNFDKMNAMAKRYNIPVSDNLKKDWYALLDQWIELGLEPYVKYERPYMIDYDSIKDIAAPTKFEYLIDLDTEDLIIDGFGETVISLEDLYNMTDEEFICTIYDGEQDDDYTDDNSFALI